MSPEDRQLMFAALGFLAVIMRDDVPRDRQTLRAAAIADLIEAYCRDVLPEAFNDRSLETFRRECA